MKLSIRSRCRRAGGGGPSVSLFPFLAVLICMMGALVPLLLAMTRTARLQAEAAGRAKAAEKIGQYNAELRVKREDAQWMIAQIKQSRRKTESQLADARLALGNIEAHAQELRGKLQRRESVVAELESVEKADRRQQNQTEADLQQVRGQIDAAQHQLTEARKNADQRNHSYAVMPYEGPNHTRRRPIYIECCADAVVLQPEGIRLTDGDFDGPLGPGNPLAVALRTICQRLIEQRAFDPNIGQPYPLLLVRPDGIPAYYAARAAMRSWGNDFGYELVGDDWQLAYQPPDLRLADSVRQAVASARARQARLIAAAPSQYQGRGTRGEGSETGDGGLGTGDVSSSREAAGLAPRGEAPAEPVALVADAGSEMGGGERGTGGRYGSYSGATKRPATAVAGGVGNGELATGGGPETGGGGLATGGGGQATGGGGLGTGSGGLGTGVAGSGSASNPYVTAAERPATAVAGGFGGVGGGSPTGGVGSGSAAPYGAAYGNAYGTPSSSGAPGSANALRGGTSNGTDVGAYITNTNSSASPTARAGGSPATSSGSSTAAGENRVMIPEGYVTGRPGRASTAAGSNTASPDAPRGYALRPGEWEPTPPKPRDDKDDKKDKKDDPFNKKRPPPERVATRRGDDWALRDAARGAIGITRSIRVACYADRLVVASDRNGISDRVVALGPRTASSIDPLMAAVWARIDGWGIAGRGMYWRPVLQVSVAPGAEDRFTDLTALLEGSGLKVERKN
jgi:hypothetical protein